MKAPHTYVGIKSEPTRDSVKMQHPIEFIRTFILLQTKMVSACSIHGRTWAVATLQ